MSDPVSGNDMTTIQRGCGSDGAACDFPCSFVKNAPGFKSCDVSVY